MQKIIEKFGGFVRIAYALQHDYGRGDVHPMTEAPLVQDYGCARPSSFFSNFKCNIMDNKEKQEIKSNLKVA